MLQHVSDNLAVVEALAGRGSPAIVIGHDWGAPIAASSALLRPDIFTAVAMLSVPYSPPGRRRPTEAFAEMGRQAGQDEEFYISYFQEPGRAEREAEIDVRSWLRGFYVAASADASGAESIATVARGKMLRDRFAAPGPLPGWLTEDDLEFYAGEFERTGFRGALNRYRNMDRDWQDLQPWRGAPVRVPSLFIGGEQDGPTRWGARAIARFPATLPGLRGSHILPRCGHWVQQEQPDEVNRLLVDWLTSL
jgi:pimeloyl-ACP methyl ester carboxylesterase